LRDSAGISPDFAEYFVASTIAEATKYSAKSGEIPALSRNGSSKVFK